MTSGPGAATPFLVQLLVVHQILIGAAIALSLLFGLRSGALSSHGGGTGDLVLAVVSFAVAAILALYLRKVRARWLAERSAARR